MADEHHEILITVRGSSARQAVAAALFHAFAEYFDDPHCNVVYEGSGKPMPEQSADTQLEQLRRQRKPLTAVIRVEA